MNNFKKGLCMILTVIMVFSVFIGCSKKEDKVEGTTKADTKANSQSADDSSGKEDKQPIVEYTVYHSNSQIEAWLDNDNDVVTKYIEDKFGLKAKEVILRGESGNKFNTLVAANAVPDVIIASQDRMPEMINMGVAKDLTELVPKYMPNYWNKIIKEKDKPFHYTDGKIYNIFGVQETRSVDETLINDPYYAKTPHTLLTREDLLEAAGYKFKPIAQIEAECKAEGRVPTMEDLQTEPAIKTPEDLRTYLEKLQALNIKVEGLDFIPMTLRWGLFHVGTMYDTGHWKWDADTKTAHGYVGALGAKDYYSYLHGLYQDGLLDKDFLINKKEQAQQKVFSGRVGVFMPDVGNAFEIQSKLKATNPDYVLRPIYFPREEKHGVYDCYVPGWWKFAINKDLDEETTIRILQMWDWLMSDEALDIVYWGPEEAGLYTEKDGKRVFKDAAWTDAIKEKTEEAGGPQDSGLYNYAKGKFFSLIGNVAPVPERFITYPRLPEKTLDPEVNVLAKLIQISAQGMMGTDASTAYGNGGENVSKVPKFFWDEFRKSPLAKLMVAKDKEEFDKVWKETLDDLERVTNYEDASKSMKEYFESKGL